MSADAPLAAGPSRLRRALLGLAAALVVARTLLPAEDPGLLESSSNALALVVPFLWFVALAGWAAWRWWAQRPAWYAGAVEAGLFAVVFFAFLATPAAASNRHAAWLVSWEWAGLFAAFFLARQLARDAADARGLLAALLASGVCLAAQSLWQRAAPPPAIAPLGALDPADWPRFRCQMLATTGFAPPADVPLGSLILTLHKDGPTSFQGTPARYNVALETDEPALPSTLRPKVAPPPAATFSSVTNFAGLLALLLPALGGCALAAWLGGAPRWRVGAVFACAALVALALVLTRRRSAVLPCLLVGAAAAVLAWRHAATHPSGRVSPRLLLLLGLGGLAAALGLAFVLRSSEGDDFRSLFDDWTSAWEVAREHPWLGVGPGNFVRHSPAFLPPSAPEDVAHPSNFLHEVWAEDGLFAAAGLAFALLAFFLTTLGFKQPPLRAAAPLPDDDGEPRWEFYLGGLFGLLLGFVLRAQPLPPEEIAAEGVMAGLRAVVWFAIFALLQDVRWSGATRVLACTAGVAALLIHLTVAGTISVPGVAQPLLVMMALALNGLPENPVPVGNAWLGRLLPLPLSAATALTFLLQILGPVTTGASTRRAALAVAQISLDRRGGVSPDGRATQPRDPGQVLGRVATGLKEAVEADPLSPRLWADRANWFGELHEAFPANPRYLAEALNSARTAQELDPRGEAGYLAEARLLLMASRPRSGLVAAMGPEMAKAAPTPLLKLAAFRPRDARLRYRVAEALRLGGDFALGRVHAAKALELDDKAPTPARKLTVRQRERLREWAAPGPN